jgi:phosphoesterase RecJ-like protein
VKKPRAMTATPQEVAERLRREERVLAVTHEAPDGDALGSVSALILMCDRLGVSCTGYVPGQSAFPSEYSFLPGLDRVARGDSPVTAGGLAVYFLDCASSLRGDVDGLPKDGLWVNIDHHQDNPGFGDVNLIDPEAASTTAILYEIFKAGGFRIDEEVATALYVGLVTDTGRFQYSNTTAAAHRLAAQLQDMGCNVAGVYRQVYESVPLPKMMLMQRMVSRMERRLGDALVVSWLGNGDLEEVGADEGHTEGLIDTLRCLEGVRVAALARERKRGPIVETKVSLRSTDGSVDVAELAHERGGGGHTRAAGFTSDGSAMAVLNWIENALRERL